MKNLLVVIDMVNGFVNEGYLADKNIDKITPNIVKLIAQAQKAKLPIIAFTDCHSKEDEEFKIFPPHCIAGTSESELIPAIKAYEKDLKVIKKNTTNGFITTEFTKLLERVEFDKVYVCGCCTDICVQNFVESYLVHIKKHNLTTQICVIDNACYTFDNQSHNANECHNKAIEHMKSQGATIVSQEKSNIVLE